MRDKINEIIKNTNEIPDYIDQKIKESFEDEHIRELISDIFRTIEDAISANNEGTNTNFENDYKIGALLWHDNKLYRAKRHIDAGDTVIVDTNIELVNFADMFDEFITEIKTDFTDNDDGLRETSSTDRPMHDLVWLNNILYEVIRPIAEGNAYIYSGANKNVEQINLDKIYDYLLDLISSEINAREEADDTLQDNIDAEANAREEADVALQNNIDAEATTRENADTILQNNIDAEATARENADTTLQNNIDAEETDRENAIQAEATARENADNLLSERITSIAQSTMKTIFDYGYQTGENITQYVQAFINDDSASELYLHMNGSYVIDTLDVTAISGAIDKIKHFTKSANTYLSGDGAVQMSLATSPMESAEIRSMYSTGSDGYPHRFVRNSNTVHTPNGNTQINAMFIDNVLNKQDGFYHWNILGQSNIYSETTGEDCVAYLQAHVYGDNENWALATENILHLNGERHNTRGIEVALTGAGDVSPNGGKRIGIHIVTNTTGGGFNADYGLFFSSHANNTGFKRLIEIANGYSEYVLKGEPNYTCVYGIDFSECNVNGAAIRLGKEGGHCIQFSDFVVVEEDQLGVEALSIRKGNNKLSLLLNTSGNVSGIVTYMDVIYNGQTYKIPLYQ